MKTVGDKFQPPLGDGVSRTVHIELGIIVVTSTCNTYWFYYFIFIIIINGQMGAQIHLNTINVTN